MFSLLNLVQPFIMNIKISAYKRRRNSRLRLILMRHKMSAREISARLPSLQLILKNLVFFCERSEHASERTLRYKYVPFWWYINDVLLLTYDVAYRAGKY